MALSQYFQERCNVDGNPSLPQKWKSEMADEASVDNPNGCFDCNICLENAQDPVVTLCGHLYCWPCIYKWLHFQPTSIDSEQKQQNCPVCKADISDTTLVPLYGRGLSTPQEKESDNKGTLQGLSIPQRPSACGVHALIAAATTTTSSSIPHSNQPIYRNPYHMTSISMTPRGTTTTTTSVVHPMMGMFGEMVYARVFGNPELSFYSAYQNMGSGSPRVRRWEMKADKSLNRISIFLFCCFVLCFLLF